MALLALGSWSCLGVGEIFYTCAQGPGLVLHHPGPLPGLSVLATLPQGPGRCSPAERPEEGRLVLCCLFRALTPADSHSPWGVHARPHRNWILGRCPSSPGCPHPPPRAALNRPTVLGLSPCTLPAPAATHLQEGSTCEKGFRGLKHSNYC